MSDTSRNNSSSSSTMKSKNKKADNEPKKIFIANLSGKIHPREHEDQIKNIFKKDYQISQISVKQARDGRHCFAFVEFESSKDAKSAIENYNGEYIGNQRVRIEFQKGGPRPQRQRSNVCFKCQKPGHIARNCTQDVEPEERQKSQEHQSRQNLKKKKRSSSIDRRKSSRSSSDSEREKSKKKKKSHKNKKYSSSSQSSQKKNDHRKQRKNKKSSSRDHKKKRRHESSSNSDRSQSKERKRSPQKKNYPEKRRYQKQPYGQNDRGYKNGDQRHYKQKEERRTDFSEKKPNKATVEPVADYDY